MRMFHYRDASDFFRAQSALMRWVAQAGPCNYLHKGDVGHRLYNNCYGYDKADTFRYWQDDAGELLAFALLQPQWQSFELMLAPALRRSAAHRRLLQCCERETLRLGKKIGQPCRHIRLDVDDCDPAFMRFIRACGYEPGALRFSFTRHDLRELPHAPLPAGFQFHAATAADAARLADVHNHSFTKKWDATSYGEVFRAPHIEREWVLRAPDSRFAAFTNLWVDEHNRSLLFEPVGTHADFRRRGLAKALMAYALRRMQAEHGICCAYVGHEPPAKNPASGALYRSLGFRKLYDTYEYTKIDFA